MSWKSQCGTSIGRNVNFTNLNFNNGIFKYKNNKLVHKNDITDTLVGIGTLSPYSRLSFGNYNISDEKDFTFALHETPDHNEKLGLTIYKNKNTKIPDVDFGLEFIVDGKDKKTKMIITDNGQFFFKDYPTVSIYDFNVNGSLVTKKSFKVGYEEETKGYVLEEGTLRYSTENGLQLKKANNEWGRILLNIDAASYWKKEINSENIYKQSKVTIKDPNLGTKIPKVNHTLSIQGNVVIGNENTLNTQIKNVKTGIVIINNSLYIGKNKNDHVMKSSLEINDDTKPFIITGVDNLTYDKDSKDSIIFGNNNNVKNSNFIFGNSNKTNGKNTLVVGDDNILIGETTTTQFGSYTMNTIQDITPNFSYIMGKNNKSNGKYSFLYGQNNIVNTNNEATLQTITNKIIFGENNNITDKNGSANMDNTAKPFGFIFGNNNNILSFKDAPNNNGVNTNIYGFIVGESNKIQGNKDDVKTIMIGDDNECYDSGLVLGNNNVHGDRTHIKKNNFNSFLIGNDISNVSPWNHSGWGSHNKLPFYPNVNSQPPILLTVGQGYDDGSENRKIHSSSSSFTVDVSGNVRCNNIVMKNNGNNTGGLYTTLIDSTKFAVNGAEFDGVNHYTIHFQLETRKTNGYGTIDKIIKNIVSPYKGKIIKIISLLDYPNISFNQITRDSVQISFKQYNNNDIALLTHNYYRHNQDLSQFPGNLWTNIDANIQPNNGSDGGQKTSWIKSEKQNTKTNQRSIINNTVDVGSIIKVTVEKEQLGYSQTALMKSNILIIIEKSN